MTTDPPAATAAAVATAPATLSRPVAAEDIPLPRRLDRSAGLRFPLRRPDRYSDKLSSEKQTQFAGARARRVPALGRHPTLPVLCFRVHPRHVEFARNEGPWTHAFVRGPQHRLLPLLCFHTRDIWHAACRSCAIDYVRAFRRERPERLGFGNRPAAGNVRPSQRGLEYLGVGARRRSPSHRRLSQRPARRFGADRAARILFLVGAAIMAAVAIYAAWKPRSVFDRFIPNP